MTVYEKYWEALEDVGREYPVLNTQLNTFGDLCRDRYISEELFEKLIVSVYKAVGRVPRWYKGVLPFVFGVDVPDMDVGKIEIGVND